MPIVVVDPLSGPLGPGFQIQVRKEDPIPPVGWSWFVDLIGTTEVGNTLLWEFTQDSNGQAVQNLGCVITAFTGRGFIQGQGIDVQIGVKDENGLTQDLIGIPQGYTFDGQSNEAAYLQLQPQAEGGLSAEQAEQLANTDEASSLAAVTDALLLTELSSGPSSGPVVVDLADVTFGIIVRLVTIPEGLTPQTPDQQYWVKTLATVRVFRGNDLWMRVPIHTPTKIIPFEKEGLIVWVTNLTLTQWLLNIHVVVDFLPGVTGRVYQMHFP